MLIQHEEDVPEHMNLLTLEDAWTHVSMHAIFRLRFIWANSGCLEQLQQKVWDKKDLADGNMMPLGITPWWDETRPIVQLKYSLIFREFANITQASPIFTYHFYAFVMLWCSYISSCSIYLLVLLGSSFHWFSPISWLYDICSIGAHAEYLRPCRPSSFALISVRIFSKNTTVWLSVVLRSARSFDKNRACPKLPEEIISNQHFHDK